MKLDQFAQFRFNSLTEEEGWNRIEEYVQYQDDLWDDLFYQNDDTPPWGNRKRKEKGEDGPEWVIRSKFEDELANFMLEKKSHTKGIGEMLDQHRNEMHEQFSQILSAVGESKTPKPKAPTFSITTRSGVSTRDPPFPTPSKPTPANTKGATEKEGPEGAEPSITYNEEPAYRPSIFYQPSKSSNLPFPSRVKKQKKDAEDERLLSIFKQIHINLQFLEAMIHMPRGAKVLKDLLYHKEKLEKAASSVKLSEECSAIIQMSLPQKEGDPRSFTLPCLIGPIVVKNALADLGASINLMTHSFFWRLGISKLKPTRMSIQLADRSIKYPIGVCENLLVKLSLRVRSETVTFNMGKSMKSKHSRDDYLYCADHTAKLVQEQWVDIVNHDGKWTEVDEEEDSNELKELPEHLEYAFLQENNQLLVVISSALSTVEKAKLLEVLRNYKGVIAWSIADIKGIDLSFCTHKILMEDEFKLSVQPQRRVSPVQVVLKKGGMTVVKNKKNELIPQRTVTRWRMLERLAGHGYYYFLDGFSGYFQIPIAPEDQEKTTFTCPYGTFAYKRMPFGLCNAPATFQHCMIAIFHELIEDNMEVFMDDFSIFCNFFDHCLKNLEKMLKRCKETNLVLNWEKCHFMVKEGIVLGHKVSGAGIEVDKAKIEAISKFPYPTNVKAIQSFLGHAGFNRRFIKDFSQVARPITQLLVKDAPFNFSEECIQAFENDYAVGAVLGQRIDKHFKPIHYVSKTMNEAQESYTTTEKGLLAVVFAFVKFRQYLVLSKTIVFTDHSALRYLFTKQDAKPRLIRWIMLLQEFDIEIHDKKGAENLAADHLSRLENPDLGKLTKAEIRDLFPEERLMAVSDKNNEPVAKDLWERVQLLMQVTSFTKQERECKPYDAFDKFTHIKGESLNTLPPEWSKFITDVKLVKDSHTSNFDQLYAYLEQHELHANEVGFVVLVFSPRDDPIACLNKTMTFLTAVASSRFPTTNNQLRTSSNLRNQATIQDGRVTVEQV
ncbi:putative nucleotidyltransferase, ribonuclease H [Tanacetum coccineum]